MSPSAILEVLSRHLPPPGIEYCYKLWIDYPFKLVIKNKRDSKYGDYRFVPPASHTITLNNDLNKYAFLITYIHEVAHLKAGLTFGYRIKPHGDHWKSVFVNLLSPMLKEEVFPPDVLEALSNYLKNPKASSCSDIELIKCLSLYDANNKFQFLSDVRLAETFRFNDRVFIKEKVNRTRALCKEVRTNKKYYISQAALVERLQMSLF